MKRRTAIKNSAFLLGGILSATTISSLLEGCVAPAEGEVWTPDFLSIDEGKIVTSIADILIPTTDTPGAIDALIPQYIDRVGKIMLDEEAKKAAKEGFNAFSAACKEATGKSFIKCSEAEQISFLQDQEKAFVESDEGNFFGKIKEAIYQGFFTSEAGATEVLIYDPVPGNYDGCIDYSEVNGTWAS